MSRDPSAALLSCLAKASSRPGNPSFPSDRCLSLRVGDAVPVASLRSRCGLHTAAASSCALKHTRVGVHSLPLCQQVSEPHRVPAETCAGLAPGCIADMAPVEKVSGLHSYSCSRGWGRGCPRTGGCGGDRKALQTSVLTDSATFPKVCGTYGAASHSDHCKCKANS